VEVSVQEIDIRVPPWIFSGFSEFSEIWTSGASGFGFEADFEPFITKVHSRVPSKWQIQSSSEY
jgi:hypothetical protein